MKKILFIILLALDAFAQSSQPWSVTSTGSSLPTNIPRAGYLFFRTADSTLHQSTGLSWRQIGPTATATSPWTESTPIVSLVTTTNDVVIGAAGQVEAAKFSIDGDADQKQFVLQGHSTQTNNLVEWQNSTPTDLMTFSNAGLMSFISTGNVSVPGAGASSQHFGLNSTAAGAQSTALGNSADANGTDAVAIGENVSAPNLSVVIGRGMNPTGVESVWIGSSNGQGSSAARVVCIGQNANNTTGATDAVSIGDEASTLVAASVAIGAQSETDNGGNGVAIGYQAIANGTGPISIGRQASSGTGSSYGIAIGQEANAGGQSSICLGRFALGYANNLFTVGSSSFTISTFQIGNGNTNTAPQALTYRMTDGSGTNISGTNWTFIASRGTGTGAGGDFIWQGSVPGSSGSALNAAVQRMKLEDDALLTLGVSGQAANSILRLTATDGDQWDVTINTSDQLLLTNASGGYSADNNFGIGTTVFGASATNELAIGNGTALTSQPIDMIQIQSRDFAAGDARMYVQGESGDQIALGNDQIVFDAEETNSATIKYESLTADREWTFTNRTAEVTLGLDAYKTADETVTNSTTPQDDDHLTESLLASSTYKFEIEGFYTTASANAGIKVELSGTVGVSALKANVHLYDDANDNFDAMARVTALDSPVGTDETGDNHFTITGTIETSTAGTFLLQWSQNTIDAVNGTTLQRNSSMILTRL